MWVLVRVEKDGTRYVAMEDIFTNLAEAYVYATELSAGGVEHDVHPLGQALSWDSTPVAT